MPVLGVCDGAVVMGPVVVLAAVVSGDVSRADSRPGLAGVVDEDRVVGGSSQVIVHVVSGAEGVVVPAVADQLVVLVYDEMACVEMLVGRKTVGGLKEKIGRILIPGAAGIDVARAGAEVRKLEIRQIALFDGGVAPEEVLVRIGTDARTRRGLVERVDGLVSGIAAEIVDKYSSCGEDLVAVAAEYPASAIAHRHGPARAVNADAGVCLEHACDSAILKKAWGVGIVVFAFAEPGGLAEKEPFVEKVIDIVALGPSAPFACELESGRGSCLPVLFKGLQDFNCARVLVIGCVAGQADSPVLLAVPAVVKDVRFAANVGIDSLVHVIVKFTALLGGPVWITKVINDRAASQVVGKGDVPFPNRPVDIIHRHLHAGLAQLFILLYCANQGYREHFFMVVGLRLARDLNNAFVRLAALGGQLLQTRAGTK